MAALYANHPYGIPIIGWEHEIAALNREDALSFYRRFYAPDNAHPGDRRRCRAGRGEEACRGDVRQARAEPRLERQAPAAGASPFRAGEVTLEDPRAGRTTVQRFYLAPSYASAKPGEAEALDLLMRIAATGSVSKIYKRLVIEDKQAANAGGWYSNSGLDSGRLGFYAIAAENVGAEALDKAIYRRGRGAQADRRHAGGARPRRAPPISPSSSTPPTASRAWRGTTAGGSPPA